MEQIPISKFKARCLAILERVRRTGKPTILVVNQVDRVGPAAIGAHIAEAATLVPDPVAVHPVSALTGGTDAQGEVTVRLEKGGRIVNGQGADTDIVIASALAYINACNKLLEKGQREHPQTAKV